MTSFEQAMVLTRTVSSNAAFEDEECRAYFDILMSLAPASQIVEIGLQYGRSSSLALQVAQFNALRYLGIDSFHDHADVAAAWLRMALPFRPFSVAFTRSVEADVPSSIHCLLIDGDHAYATVLGDCARFAPRVASGGYLLAHDFGRDSLQEVFDAMTEFMDDNPRWETLCPVGCLGIWRRK